MSATTVDIDSAHVVERSENVILTSNENTDTAIISPPQLRVQVPRNEGGECEVAKELANRWFTYETITWQSSDGKGDEIWNMDFPTDLFAKHWGKINNLKMLEPYMYFAADLEVRIQSNVTKFHVGQLQISAYYAEDRDKYIILRNNIWSRSQMMSVLMSASSANEATLFLPYRYVKPYFRTRNCSGVCPGPLVSVRMLVLNPLVVTEGVSKQVDLTVYIRLSNVYTSGMIPSTLPQKLTVDHQMFSLMRMGLEFVESAYYYSKGSSNRDQPREVRAENVVIPRQAGSWSLGTNITSLSNILRLDNFGIQPAIKNEQFTIRSVASRFGLFDQFDWGVDSPLKEVLFSVSIDPMLFVKQLEPRSSERLGTYAVPPISVISSMFAYWRGSIDLRFDFVASGFHTGRLLCVFCPGITDLRNVPKFKSGSSNLTSVIFDLGMNQSFTFNVPFFYDRFWAPVQSNDRENERNFGPGTGMVLIMVLNKLVKMTTIPSTVTVNCYVAGGNDYELSVPVAPCIGLAWDRDYNSEQSDRRAKDGYSNVYVGVWRYFNGSKSPMLRYGNVSDHVAQFTNLKKDTIYEFNDGTSFNAGGLTFSYFVSPTINQDPYQYLAVFRNLQSAKDFITDNIFEEWTKESNYVDVTNKPLVIVWELNIQHQIGVSDVLAPSVQVSNISRFHFGEDFNDLKNLIRRFQPYYSTTIQIQKVMPFGSTVLRLPLSFAGLKLDPNTHGALNESVNRQRNGMISILSSGYRFFRGGMRVRIVCDSPNNGVYLGVLHVPELPVDSERASKPKLLRNRDYNMGGYAMFAQSYRLNQTLDVEIPFYLPGDRGFLQRGVPDITDLAIFSSLGSLEFTLMNRVQKDFDMDLYVFISAADDTEFIGYTGFPPMVMLKDIPPVSFSEADKQVIERGKFDTKVDDELERKEDECTSLSCGSFEFDVPGTSYKIILSASNLSIAVKKAGVTAYYKHFSSQSSAPHIYYAIGESTAKLKKRTLLFNNDPQSGIFYKLKADGSLDYYFPRYKLIYIDITGWQSMGGRVHGLRPKRDADQLIPDEMIRDLDHQMFVDHQVFEAVTKTTEKVGDAADKITDSVKKLEENVDRGVDKLIEVSDEAILTSKTVRATVENTEERMSRLDQIIGAFSSVWKGSVSLLRSLLAQLIHFFRSPSKESFAACVIGFIIQSGESIGACMSSVYSRISDYFANSEFWTKLSYYVTHPGEFISALRRTTESKFEALRRRRLPRSQRNEAAEWGEEMHVIHIHTTARAADTEDEFYDAPVDHQMGDSDVAASYASLLVTISSALVGVKEDKIKGKPPLGIMSGLFKGIGSAAKETFYLERFLKNSFSVIAHLTRWIKSYMGYHDVISDLQNAESRVNVWYKQSVLFTNATSRTYIESEPVLMEHMYSLSVQSQSILEDLMDADNFANKAHIIRMITEQKRKLDLSVDEMIKTGKIVSSKYEPFCIHISGKPGIGKSRMTEDMSARLLEEAGIRFKGSMIYNRQPTSSYWNLVSDQPVCVYDDWLNIGGEESKNAISELFQLKTSTVFNVEKAAVDEKKHCYSPKLIVLNSNCAYPSFTDVNDKTAVYRRRDMLVSAYLDPAVEKKYGPYAKDIPESVLKNYGHLKFQIYVDPSTEHSGKGEELSYSQFMEILNRKHLEWRKKNVSNFRSRVTANLRKKLKHMEEKTILESFLTSDSQSSFGSLFGGLMNVGVSTDEAREIYDDIMKEPVLEPQLFEEHMQSAEEIKESMELQMEQGKKISDFLCSESIQSCAMTSEVPANWKCCHAKIATAFDFKEECYDCGGSCFRDYTATKCLAPGRPCTGIELDEQGVKYCAWQVKSLRHVTLSMFVLTMSHRFNQVKQSFDGVGFIREIESRLLDLDYSYERLEGQSGDNSVACEDNSRRYRVVAPLGNNFFQSYSQAPWRKELFGGKAHATLITSKRDEPDVRAAKIYQANKKLSMKMYAFSLNETEYRNMLISDFDKEAVLKDEEVFNSIPDIQRVINLEEHGELAEMYVSFVKEKITYNGSKLAFVGNELEKHLTLTILKPDSVELDAEKVKLGSDFPVAVDVDRPAEKSEDDKVEDGKTTEEEEKEDENESWFAKLWRKAKYIVVSSFGYVKDTFSWMWDSLCASCTSVVDYLSPRARSVYSQMKEWGSKTKDVIKKSWFFRPISAAILGAVFLAHLICKGVSWLSDRSVRGEESEEGFEASVDNSSGGEQDSGAWLGKAKENIQGQLSSSGDMKTHARKGGKTGQGSRGARLGKLKFGSIEPQSYDDTAIRGFIRRNSVQFSVGSMYVKGLGVAGRWAITVKHFKEKLDAIGVKHVEILVPGGKKTTVNVSDMKFETYNESSLCLVEVPRSIPSFRDLRKHIIPADLVDRRNIKGELIWMDDKGYINSKSLDIKDSNHTRIQSSRDGTMKDQTLEDTYRYGFQKPGLCGSPIVCYAGTRPYIIGCHVAGSQQFNIGYSQAIVSEMFSELKVIDSVEPQYGELDAREFKISSNVLVLGQVESDQQMVPPMKTKLMKLPTYGVFAKPTMEPAPLDPKDDRIAKFAKTPLQYGVDKHGHPPIPFETEKVYRVYEDYRDKILAMCKPVIAGKSVLTDIEVVRGFPGVQGYSGLKMDTSEGYPLVLERPKEHKNKKWLFNYEVSDQGNILKSINPKLKEMMKFNGKLRNEGVIPNTIFVDTLKDCKLPIEKCRKEGGTRIFSESPIEYTFAVKKYFGHFQAAMIARCIDSESCVGINATSSQWGILWEKLNSIDSKPHFVTGDYSHYGDSLNSDCVRMAFQIMLDWYDDNYGAEPGHIKNQRVRKVLVEELMQVQHLAKNTIYRMFCGIPSGFPLTVEVNSMVNAMYMRLAWMEAFKDDPKMSLSHFGQNVCPVFYGDDLLLSISDKAFPKYNFLTINKFLSNYGIAFTPASKEKDVSKYTSELGMEEITFLKRGFVPHPSRSMIMLAPLPKESIYSCLDWTWKTEDPMAASMSNARDALSEMYHHGKVQYDELRTRLTKWFGDSTGEHFRSDTWSEQDDKLYGLF